MISKKKNSCCTHTKKMSESENSAPVAHGSPLAQLYYNQTKQKHYILIKPAYR